MGGRGEWGGGGNGGEGGRGGMGGGGEWGGGGGEWGGWRSISLLCENSILLIKVQGYRGLTEKWKTVKKVHTLRYSVIKISEYFRGVVFREYFGIYCAANHGSFCSGY